MIILSVCLQDSQVQILTAQRLYPHLLSLPSSQQTLASTQGHTYQHKYLHSYFIAKKNTSEVNTLIQEHSARHSEIHKRWGTEYSNPQTQIWDSVAYFHLQVCESSFRKIENCLLPSTLTLRCLPLPHRSLESVTLYNQPGMWRTRHLLYQKSGRGRGYT